MFYFIITLVETQMGLDRTSVVVSRKRRKFSLAENYNEYELSVNKVIIKMQQ